jgi:hypothetical protein
MSKEVFMELVYYDAEWDEVVICLTTPRMFGAIDFESGRSIVLDLC